MTDFERLMRASDFCHSMAAIALERHCFEAFMAWRAHGKAYSSAARLLSRRTWRRSVTEGRTEPCKRNGDGLCRSWRAIFSEHNQ
jgi:hypothetical protein